MKNDQPLVSVVMPVYNSEAFLGNSIESILAQEFSDFEFIIIDDGSTDGSLGLINTYKDPRIILLRNSSNKGNYFSRNTGCRKAKGKYIAVMDCDDIALPGRLNRQVGEMEGDESLLVVGSDHLLLYPDGQEHARELVKEYQLIKLWLLKDNTALHPSLMIRREAFEDIGFYNEDYFYSSDYDMLCRLSLKGKIIGIPDILVKYRIHKKQISFAAKELQGNYANMIRLKYLEACGFNLDEHECKIFSRFMQYGIINHSEMIPVENMLNKLLNQNYETDFFDQDLLYSFFYYLASSSIYHDKASVFSPKTIK